eukprot:4669184-Lingulodinium_polyedra.AAC.1
MVGPTEFWKLYGDVAALILDKAKVKRVLECTTAFHAIAEELTVLSNSSAIGRRLFARANEMVVSDNITKVMVEKLAALTEKKVDQNSIFAWNAEVKAQLVAMPDVDTVSARREVLVPYRGENIKVVCKTFHDEWQARVH